MSYPVLALSDSLLFESLQAAIAVLQAKTSVITYNYDPPSLAVGSSSAEQVVAFTNAALGDFIYVVYIGDSKGIEFPARVSAAGQITFRAKNPSDNPNGTIDLASGVLNMRLVKAS